MQTNERVKGWPGRFIELGLLTLVRNKDYLISVIGGRLSCKACGRLLLFTNPDKHFQMHQAEVDEYLGAKQEESRVENTEGFYPNSCESCGAEIPRTGKSGRPPKLCNACKGVKPVLSGGIARASGKGKPKRTLADGQALSDADEKLLAELGL